LRKKKRPGRAAYIREYRKRYPKNWQEIRAEILKRSKGQCECDGECGLHTFDRCCEKNGKPGKNMAGTVRLQVAHLNHVEKDCRPENLKAMCQRCHLRYDRVLHADGARKTRNKQRGQIDALDELSFQEALTMLLLDLEANPMKVILAPAPEPRYWSPDEGRGGHMIRVVESRPPPWYLKLCQRWGYWSKRRGRFERRCFLAAINRAREGVFTGGVYMDAVLEMVKHAQRDPEEVFLNR
jgi:hypothetical protein